jgi:hypothetical protein
MLKMNATFPEPDLSGLPPEEMRLRQWMATWYHFALEDGYILPQFELDMETAERLEGYFKVGLTPDEGVGALFGTLH